MLEEIFDATRRVLNEERLNEMTIGEFTEQQKSIYKLYPPFKERVEKVKHEGGIRLVKETPDRWDFNVASGTRPDRAKHRVNVVFDNMADLVYEGIQDKVVWKTGTNDINYTKLAQWILPKLDLKLSCSCENFLYGGFRYILTQADSVYLDKENRAPTKRNPNEYGAGCKHTQAVFDQFPFYSQVFAKHIKKFYGKVIDKAIGDYANSQFPDVAEEDTGSDDVNNKGQVDKAKKDKVIKSAKYNKNKPIEKEEVKDDKEEMEKEDKEDSVKAKAGVGEDRSEDRDGDDSNDDKDDKIKDSLIKYKCFRIALRESEFTFPSNATTNLNESVRLCENVLGLKEAKKKKKEKKSSLDKFKENHGIKAEGGLGWSEQEQKWYGWSHRGICGFGINDIVKEGDVTADSLKVGFKAKNLNDAKKMAKAYQKGVN